MRTTRPTRRTAVAVGLITIGVAGIGIASAARLALETAPLGAGSTVVAGCQPEKETITVSFATEFQDGAFHITDVLLDNVRCPDDSAVAVALSTGGTTFVEGEGRVTAAPGQTRVPVSPVPVESVDAVAVLIEG